jgi:hypothetical protein
MQHPHQPNHREALRRSSGAARKDSCTACERTAFTPCCRKHSAVDTHQWREEPTSTWPNRRQPVERTALQPPRHTCPHTRAPTRRWSKPPTPPHAATPPHTHSARAAAARTPTTTDGNPAMQGLDTAAPPPRPRRHREHPNARHQRPPDPGPRTPPLQRRRAPARHRTAPRHSVQVVVVLSWWQSQTSGGNQYLYQYKADVTGTK